MHGMPQGILDAMAPGMPRPQRTAVQNCAIGNGFHLPSLMVALLVLFQLGQPSAAQVTPWHHRMATVSSLSDPEEQALAQRFHHSPFNPAVYQEYPHLLRAEEIVEDMRQQFTDLHVHEQAFLDTQLLLDHTDLAAFQIYFGWIGARGRTHAGTRCRPGSHKRTRPSQRRLWAIRGRRVVQSWA